MRILVISPFFIMPPVAALIWKNMFMNPTNGLFAAASKALGLQPDRVARRTTRSLSIILIVAWQWLPFATLILLTALQSLVLRAARGGRDGRRAAAVAVLVHHAAAPRPRRSPSWC